MLGGMQDFELRVPRLIDHAAREHGGREIVTRWADGRETRSNWAGIAADARRCAQALERIGCVPGDRIATLAMNHGHHLATWYGAIGMGGVIHTINPRLFDEQLVYIVNHAADRVLFHDRAFQPIIDRLRDRWPTVERYVVMDSDGPDGFRAFVDAENGAYAWVEGPERDPCMLCYTSGTTGNPKGVLYEHRSTMLHAMAEVAPAVFDLSSRAVALPIVPMFHAAAWGLPFAGALAGAKFVFSAVNDPVVLCDLMNRERVTHSAGVPTVWLGLFQHIDATGEAPRYLKLVSIGGSAAPRAMIQRLMGMGIHVAHLWGMTETSPIGTAGSLPADWDEMGMEAQLDLACKQGQIPFGIELQVIDDDGRVRPRDGVSSGRLLVRGPWVVKRYFGAGRGCDRCAGLVRHRRRRSAASRRHDADHRPVEGRHQVGRRVDQFGRSGERRDRLCGRGGGRGDRRAASQMGRAAVAAGGAQARQRRVRRRRRAAPGRSCREMVAARCGGVRGRPAAHRDGQAAQDRAAGAVQGFPAGGGVRDRSRVPLSVAPGLTRGDAQGETTGQTAVLHRPTPIYPDPWLPIAPAPLPRQAVALSQGDISTGTWRVVRPLRGPHGSDPS